VGRNWLPALRNEDSSVHRWRSYKLFSDSFILYSIYSTHNKFCLLQAVSKHVLIWFDLLSFKDGQYIV
jgi:hypothetical protein